MRNLKLEKLLNTPWAYTGSIAMKMHANRQSVPSRNAKNINVVVIDPKMTSSFLASSGKWMYTNGPPMNSKANHVRMHRLSNGKNLNIFRFGGRLANGTNKIQFINGVPVMSLSSLRNKKLVTLINHPKNNKTQSNIIILNKLIEKNTPPPKRKNTPSPPKRNVTPSPPKRRSPPNNFSTPSPKRRLFF